jgi:hypothetical protein
MTRSAAAMIFVVGRGAANFFQKKLGIRVQFRAQKTISSLAGRSSAQIWRHRMTQATMPDRIMAAATFAVTAAIALMSAISFALAF